MKCWNKLQALGSCFAPGLSYYFQCFLFFPKYLIIDIHWHFVTFLRLTKYLLYTGFDTYFHNS